ncbi:hypothetical protein M406DRAFT_350868 [Cryphonectria parasitica EP155]|uniref:N-acetyltransferase domain-containing protein n=1 Tax=Cryphonectria parasitica (strain ATCC 38755 / EP155) TaxID=660469 RepID=A0A9P4Y7Z2_CRYP1|nr:uncharacterized protein M406DRAFT_350868 [Cryphonectria parasitica EP155]KAF3768027.1 hypothetical protein M406DRAFT_350868 [Cryphonectria parasitica EP155]
MAADFPQKLEMSFDQDDWEKLGITPWFSYKVRLPLRPLPPISARPVIRTKRLIIRPILPSDLEAFYELRRIPETQMHSTSRGRPDRSLDETRQSIARLQAPYDERHWYFGAFLASTGELIGEGGLPDTEHQPVSGWTRCEVLIKPAYWRQGYGTEFFKTVLDSWWSLPRKLRRHQLLPFCIGNQEPGTVVAERLELIWEASNTAACNFFPKALSQAPVSHEGFFTSLDWREGREGELVRWAGTMVVNPLRREPNSDSEDCDSEDSDSKDPSSNDDDSGAE